jgi:hypothetical protein
VVRDFGVAMLSVGSLTCHDITGYENVQSPGKIFVPRGPDHRRVGFDSRLPGELAEEEVKSRSD